MATERNGDPIRPTDPEPPPADDDLDVMMRRMAERAGEIERLTARINDLHGQIEAYRRRRGA
jgi:hypothetical protein